MKQPSLAKADTVKLLLTALLLVFPAGLGNAFAEGYPTIEVTARDTLSTEPLRVRTTFALSSVGYSGFVVHADLPNDAPPQFHDCESPPGWNCYHEADPSHVAFWTETYSWSEERVPGFSIVTDHAVPCVVFAFQNVVMEIYAIHACLQPDMPIPTRPASWGSVKSRYR